MMLSNQNSRGSVLIYTMMVALCIIVLALALAPSVAEFTNDARGNSTITYFYYNNVREWTPYGGSLINGSFEIKNENLSFYQNFKLIEYNNTLNEYLSIKNITLNLKRTGSPTGNISLRIFDGLPYNDNKILVANSTKQISDVGTSFQEIKFEEVNNNIFISSGRYYYLDINVTGVDNDNFISIGTTNITSVLFGGDGYMYNNTNASYWNIPLYLTNSSEAMDILFKFDLSDGGIEEIGLDCDNSSISNFNKAACYATDLSLFYVVGAWIFIAGAVITARIIFS